MVRFPDLRLQNTTQWGFQYESKKMHLYSMSRANAIEGFREKKKIEKGGERKRKGI